MTRPATRPEGPEPMRIPAASDADRWYCNHGEVDAVDGWERLVDSGTVGLDDADRSNIETFLDEGLGDQWRIAPGACQAEGEHPELWRPVSTIVSARLPGCLFILIGDNLFPNKKAAVDHARPAALFG